MKNLAIAGLGLMLAVGAVGTVLASEKAVTGTLEDSFCFVTMGAHGADHKKVRGWLRPKRNSSRLGRKGH
jgi:hypothetical protein